MSTTNLYPQGANFTQVKLYEMNGRGSVATTVARYATVVKSLNNGQVLNYQDSSTLGATFTAVVKCEVTMCVSHANATGVNWGITLNANTTEQATSINSPGSWTDPTRRLSQATTASSGSWAMTVKEILNPGDVLRMQTDGTGLSGYNMLQITAFQIG